VQCNPFKWHNKVLNTTLLRGRPYWHLLIIENTRKSKVRPKVSDVRGTQCTTHWGLASIHTGTHHCDSSANCWECHIWLLLKNVLMFLLNIYFEKKYLRESLQNIPILKKISSNQIDRPIIWSTDSRKIDLVVNGEMWNKEINPPLSVLKDPIHLWSAYCQASGIFMINQHITSFISYPY
jgi:hypothetical protein